MQKKARRTVRTLKMSTSGSVAKRRQPSCPICYRFALQGPAIKDCVPLFPSN